MATRLRKKNVDRLWRGGFIVLSSSRSASGSSGGASPGSGSDGGAGEAGMDTAQACFVFQLKACVPLKDQIKLGHDGCIAVRPGQWCEEERTNLVYRLITVEFKQGFLGMIGV